MSVGLLAGFLALSMLMNALLAAVAISSRRSRQPLPGRQPGGAPRIQSDLKKLVLDSDALNDIVKFQYWYRHDKASREDGYIAAACLLQALQDTVGLTVEGDFQDRTCFDRAKHLASAGVHLSPGDRVRVLEPGWSLGGQMIKRAVVEADS